MKWYKTLLILTLLSFSSFTFASKGSKSSYHTCSSTDNARIALACNLYKEARGEGIKGLAAVGFVTINRAKHPKFPDKVPKVVYQKSQFSWTIGNNNTKIHDKKSWEKAKTVSRVLLFIKDHENFYNVIDFTKGSLYYHNTTVKPYWINRVEFTVQVGSHLLYK